MPHSIKGTAPAPGNKASLVLQMLFLIIIILTEKDHFKRKNLGKINVSETDLVVTIGTILIKR